MNEEKIRDIENKIKAILCNNDVSQDKYKIKIDLSPYIPSGKMGISVIISLSSLTVVIYSEQLNKLIETFKSEDYEFVGIFCDNENLSIDFVKEYHKDHTHNLHVISDPLEVIDYFNSFLGD
ncbi:MAG: hypothetical protein ACP5L4_06885 [Thermoplasmata archaeon]